MAGGVQINEGDYNSEINVIPLVDVMLVLLIIFIITIPVVTKAVKVNLPTNINQPTETKPENINLSVDFAGNIYWNDNSMTMEQLPTFVRAEAIKDPQPEVHIRADRRVRYQYVGDVLMVLQRNGLLKVGFIAEPPMGG
ncbi:MAG: biopolymer transporter ExbD [Steroidobacteraceae bacterium]|jgi:biopolymer transport protein ExbD|nr:biopolymer transporter ExbD [Steroidobacteraceae bacterium]